MAQNLISASLTEQDVVEVTQSLNTVKTKLHFLSTLQKGDVKSLVKVGNAYYLPFLDKIHQVVETHPEILSAVFDKEEFLKDYELFNKLRPVYNLMNELAEGLQKTFTAVGSDTLVAALDVYASVKQNKDKVPGLSVMNDELATFFKKAKAQTADQK